MSNTLYKAENIVKTEIFCLCPSLLQDALQGEDGFLSAMFEADDGDSDDPLQFWLVSEWLAGQLVKEGGRVYDMGDAYVWGRMTVGQAIYMDSIIQRIAEKF